MFPNNFAAYTVPTSSTVPTGAAWIPSGAPISPFFQLPAPFTWPPREQQVSVTIPVCVPAPSTSRAVAETDKREAELSLCCNEACRNRIREMEANQKKIMQKIDDLLILVAKNEVEGLKTEARLMAENMFTSSDDELEMKESGKEDELGHVDRQLQALRDRTARAQQMEVDDSDQPGPSNRVRRAFADAESKKRRRIIHYLEKVRNEEMNNRRQQNREKEARLNELEREHEREREREHAEESSAGK